jgi:hypothetical protein
MAVHADAVTSANIALREATAALAVKRDISGIAPHLNASACEALTADVGGTLDAVLRLLRTAGLEPVPTSAASHNLQALIQQVTTAATMAHRTAGHDPADTGSISAGPGPRTTGAPDD